MKNGIKLRGHFHFRCIDPNGNIKWERDEDNLVVNVGLQQILDDIFTGAGQVDPWYVGLTDGAPVTVAAGDTMGAHAGWVEFEDYSEGVRQTYTDVRAAQSVSNTAAPAAFTISGDGKTIGGAFLTSDNVKGAGDGVLLCGVAFTGGDESADTNDTIEVTYTFGAVDDA